VYVTPDAPSDPTIVPDVEPSVVEHVELVHVVQICARAADGIAASAAMATRALKPTEFFMGNAWRKVDGAEFVQGPLPQEECPRVL
jgi:hypothetical protein